MNVKYRGNHIVIINFMKFLFNWNYIRLTVIIVLLFFNTYYSIVINIFTIIEISINETIMIFTR
jgi:uncharacterized protein with PIN domain